MTLVTLAQPSTIFYVNLKVFTVESVTLPKKALMVTSWLPTAVKESVLTIYSLLVVA